MSANDQLLAHLLRCLDLAGKAGKASLTPLAGSSLGATMKLSVGDARYVVRRGLFDDSSRALRREYEVLKFLEGSGLAPLPVLLSTELNYLVYEFIPGVRWTRNMLVEQDGLEALSDSLARLHAYSTPGSSPDLVNLVERYLVNETPALRRLLTRACVAAVSRLRGREVALVHYDMWCGNIIQGWNTRFIDWEYANGGSPVMDIATLVCYHDLQGEEIETLWRSYCTRVGREPPRSDLDAWCVIVDCLTLAWCREMTREGMRPDLAPSFMQGAADRLGLDLAEWAENP